MVVLWYRVVHHHRWCAQLRVRPNYFRLIEKMAVYLHTRRCFDIPIWSLVLHDAQLPCLRLVSNPRGTNGGGGATTERADWSPLPKGQIRSNQRIALGCQNLPGGYHDGSSVGPPPPPKPLYALAYWRRYTINGAISGFGPLIVSTFGYNTLDSILFQFPVGGVCVIFIPLCGYIPTRVPNTRIPMLIACCLPVIAGCAMIWKSQWGYHPVTPVVGYALTGFFGPVVSLIITVGAGNVAGATKKTVMAATVFVAYSVGNIIGPQLINSGTISQHYPELWKGLIIW